jgi:hypothetical protein
MAERGGRLEMKLDSVGRIIATRDLDLDGVEKVLVTIGAPQQTPGHADYYCPFTISGFGSREVRYAVGIDTMQALDLALRAIGSDLYSSQEYLEGRLRYLGMKNLGFPVLPGFGIIVPPENE